MIPRIHFELGLAFEDGDGVKTVSTSRIAAPSHGDLTSIIQRIRQGALSPFNIQALKLLEEVQCCWAIVNLLVRKKLMNRALFDHITALNWWKDGLEAYLQGGERLKPDEDPVVICQNALKAVQAFDRFLTQLMHKGGLNSQEVDEAIEEFQKTIEAFNSIQVFLRIESLSHFTELKERLGYLRSMVMNCIQGHTENVESDRAKLLPFGLGSSSPQAVDQFLKGLEAQIREGHVR